MSAIFLANFSFQELSVLKDLIRLHELCVTELWLWLLTVLVTG